MVRYMKYKHYLELHFILFVNTLLSCFQVHRSASLSLTMSSMLPVHLTIQALVHGSKVTVSRLFILFYFIVRDCLEWLNESTLYPVGPRPCVFALPSGWWTPADARMRWNSSGHDDLLRAAVQIYVGTPNQWNNNRNATLKSSFKFWHHDIEMIR